MSRVRKRTIELPLSAWDDNLAESIKTAMNLSEVPTLFAAKRRIRVFAIDGFAVIARQNKKDIFVWMPVDRDGQGRTAKWFASVNFIPTIEQTVR